MKEENQKDIKEGKVQDGKAIKNTEALSKTAANDAVKNAASETLGLNQTKTTRDDLFPSDGDNLTN